MPDKSGLDWLREWVLPEDDCEARGKILTILAVYGSDLWIPSKTMAAALMSDAIRKMEAAWLN